jgi:hypothetical protein
VNSSLREKALMAVLGMAFLYVGAAAGWFFYAEKEWKKSARQYQRAKEKYEKERRLISERGKWATTYEEEKANMPIFEAGKATDTTWLKKMDDMALKHRVHISQRQSGKEVDAGEVLELPLEVKSWEGSLEALVKFMHELENTDDGMFDIRSLNLRPSAKKGYLRGSFTLTCAYMRE